MRHALPPPTGLLSFLTWPLSLLHCAALAAHADTACDNCDCSRALTIQRFLRRRASCACTGCVFFSHLPRYCSPVCHTRTCWLRLSHLLQPACTMCFGQSSQAALTCCPHPDKTNPVSSHQSFRWFQGEKDSRVDGESRAGAGVVHLPQRQVRARRP